MDFCVGQSPRWFYLGRLSGFSKLIPLTYSTHLQQNFEAPAFGNSKRQNLQQSLQQIRLSYCGNLPYPSAATVCTTICNKILRQPRKARSSATNISSTRLRQPLTASTSANICSKPQTFCSDLAAPSATMSWATPSLQQPAVTICNESATHLCNTNLQPRLRQHMPAHILRHLQQTYSASLWGNICSTHLQSPTRSPSAGTLQRQSAET